MHITTNAQYSYFISNKDLPQVMRQATQYGSNCGCCRFLLQKQTVKRSAQCHVFAQTPPDRRPQR
jgi:bacterioferritin-associated ferredoxin